MYVADLSVLFIIYVATWHEPCVHTHTHTSRADNFIAASAGNLTEHLLQVTLSMYACVYTCRAI